MTARLDRKVALVTGAASGIGRAIANDFLAEGASVVLADIDATGAESVADTSERRAVATQCDVTREPDLEAAAALAPERFGGLDTAVANAAHCAAPDDIATLAVFLASDEARLISAGFYSVDGGASTRRYPDLRGAFARLADNTSP